VEAVEETHR